MDQQATARPNLNDMANVRALKAWAKEHYLEGADTFVECWSDEQYIDCLRSAGWNYYKALETLKQLASYYKDRQTNAKIEGGM